MYPNIIFIFAAGYYISVILSYTLITTSMPLFMEITCETAYPIGEGVTGGFLCMMSNLGAAIVLAFSQIQSLGKFLDCEFVPYPSVCSCPLTLQLLLDSLSNTVKPR